MALQQFDLNIRDRQKKFYVLFIVSCWLAFFKVTWVSEITLLEITSIIHLMSPSLASLCFIFLRIIKKASQLSRLIYKSYCRCGEDEGNLYGLVLWVTYLPSQGSPRSCTGTGWGPSVCRESWPLAPSQVCPGVRRAGWLSLWLTCSSESQYTSIVILIQCEMQSHQFTQITL